MRRRLLRLFLVLFALLQGISPLLHAHVMPPAGGQTGLHVHAVPIGPAHHLDEAISLSFAGVPESAAITAPAEHRRDEWLASLVLAAPPRSQPVVETAVVAVHAPAPVQRVRICADSLRTPPAQGPPPAARLA